MAFSRPESQLNDFLKAFFKLEKVYCDFDEGIKTESVGDDKVWKLRKSLLKAVLSTWNLTDFLAKQQKTIVLKYYLKL